MRDVSSGNAWELRCYGAVQFCDLRQMGHSMSCETTTFTPVLGVPIHGWTLDEFVQVACERIGQGQKTLFTTANAHSIVVAQQEPDFLKHFNEADVVLPDGMLAVIGARWCGGSVPGRVAGPDFFEAFLQRANTEGIAVFFFGTTSATLARMVEVCSKRYPRLRIAGTAAPPFGEWDDATDQRLVAEINAAAPDAVFVAMTAPKQELWLSRNAPSLAAPFAMGVGAAFDFFAGTKRRAPGFLGQAGWEWLYRLAREPRRLWRRNLNSFVFLLLLLRGGGKKAGIRP